MTKSRPPMKKAVVKKVRKHFPKAQEVTEPDNQNGSQFEQTDDVVFTKLRDGTWGIRAIIPVQEGDTVTVTQKNGQTRDVVVARVLWSDGEKSFCTVEPREEAGFTPNGTVFARISEKDWGIKGRNLVPGKVTRVVTRKGETQNVKVVSILRTDDDGFQLATFQRIRNPNQRSQQQSFSGGRKIPGNNRVGQKTDDDLPF